MTPLLAGKGLLRVELGGSAQFASNDSGDLRLPRHDLVTNLAQSAELVRLKGQNDKTCGNLTLTTQPKLGLISLFPF